LLRCGTSNQGHLPPGHRCYVFSSRWGERIEIEAWASLSERGGGRRLVTFPDRVLIGKGTLQDIYGWSCVPSIYMTNNAKNMNRVEKTAHWMLHEDQSSMWLECGMGGVHQSEGDLRPFSLSYISGSPAGLEFAAKHPRTSIRPSDPAEQSPRGPTSSNTSSRTSSHPSDPGSL